MEDTEKNEVKIPWEVYDYIGIAGCTKYEERYRQTNAELEEYGCRTATWRIDFPSPFKDAMYRIIKKARGQMRSASDFYLAMNHYGNLKTAYLTGAERALFMEDDVAFLKDKRLFAEIMSTVPDDADIALYDWRPRFHEMAAPLFGRRRIGGHWVEAGDVELLYFSMVALSRAGMKYIIDGVENGAFKSGMYDIDAYFRPGMSRGLKTYVAFPHAAMQINTGRAVHAREKPYKGIVSEADYFERGDSVKVSSKKRTNLAIAQPLHESDPIDAVFVIGTGSRRDNEELRYALRNLDAHCKFIRNVYICGECPQWVDKTIVKHLQWPDRFRHAKDANIIDKLRHACEFPGIAKKILFCSDDQFQTRGCSWDDFSPRWLKEYSPDDTWYADRHRLWHTRLRKTLERDAQRRRSGGMPAGGVYYWQPHMWMQIDRDAFIEYARWCGYERRDDTIIASGYYNFVGEAGSRDHDHVFLTGRESSAPMKTHVAYNDASYDAAMRILKSMFPQKCAFEVGYCGESRRRANADTDERTNPCAATDYEMRKISMAMNCINESDGHADLLGDVSRAEEMRLLGVPGWRIVWYDIIDRLESSSPSKMSDEAMSVVERYLSNPEAMRAVSAFDRRNMFNSWDVRNEHPATRKSIMDSLRRRMGNGIL